MGTLHRFAGRMLVFVVVVLYDTFILAFLDCYGCFVRRSGIKNVNTIGVHLGGKQLSKLFIYCY